MDPAKHRDQAELQLDSGYLFTGSAFGASVSVRGEVVFNTGMVGYTEALTDPSYTGQILVLTYPLSGNYGVPGSDSTSGFESDRICAAGLVVSSCCFAPSHYEQKMNLDQWLKSSGVPGIQGIDTRALTKHLLRNGTMTGSLCIGGVKPPSSPLSPAEQMIKSLEKHQPTGSREHRDGPAVALVDCGAKRNIARCLSDRGINVVNVPWNHSFDRNEFDGVMISNGPGDPGDWMETVGSIRSVLDHGTPVMGICLGHQILALAAGASTEKMKYGHRGQNQPCFEEGVDSPRFFLTSQNHGYQVMEDSLPPDWKVLFRNVNDDSVEGIAHNTLPFIGVQFHPEASPGPVESASLFDQFAALVRGEQE